MYMQELFRKHIENMQLENERILREPKQLAYWPVENNETGGQFRDNLLVIIWGWIMMIVLI